MKYAGNTTIVDEEGNIVHERELTADEMIEELLNREHQERIEITGGPAKIKIDSVITQPVKRKKRKCGNCKEVGHTTRTCPKSEQVHEPEEEPTTLAVSKHMFEKVKLKQADDIPSLDVADEFGLDIREVNKMYGASQYLTYIRDRKK